MPLISYIEATHRIKCHFCGATKDHESDGYSLETEARRAETVFHNIGWREVKSRKYQVQAAACPSCAKLKDGDR